MKLRARLLLLTTGMMLPLAGMVVAAERQLQTAAAEDALSSHVEARLSGDGRARCEEDPVRFALSGRPPLGRGGPFGGDGRPPDGPFGGDGPPPDGPFGGDGPPPHGPFPGDEAGSERRPPPGAREGPRLPSWGSRLGEAARRAPPGRVSLYVYDEHGASLAADAPPLSRNTLAGLQTEGATLRQRFQLGGDAGQEIVVRVGPPTEPARCAFLRARRFTPPLRLSVLRPWVPPLFVLVLVVGVGLIPVIRRIRRLETAVRASARAGYALPIDEASDDEIGDLARSFEDAGREVRAQLGAQAAREQTLRDFLANTTHDVMTPLTALKGHLAALRESAIRGEAPVEDRVGAAIDEAHYMASLLHNLGVAARLEAGEPHIVRAEVDLGRLVERVVARHRIVATQHGVSLEHAVPDEPLLAYGDETFLEQAVSNVVYNALRYNHPGGHVAVLAEVSGRDIFEIRVLDDGPGVPVDQMAAFASRNVRGDDARTRHPDGQGLGLSITSRVVALHGFELHFEGPPGGGLLVRLRGPAIVASARQPES